MPHGYNYPQRVRVIRTDGTAETNWKVSDRQPFAHLGRVTVHRYAPNLVGQPERIYKSIEVDTLDRWQDPDDDDRCERRGGDYCSKCEAGEHDADPPSNLSIGICGGCGAYGYHGHVHSRDGEECGEYA